MSRPPFLRQQPQQGGNPPTGISTSPGSVVALANSTNPTVLATMQMIGGTGAPIFSVYAADGVSSHANLTTDGANGIIPKVGAVFDAGINQQYKLGVLDTGTGLSYVDAASRTLTVPLGPSNVVLHGNQVSKDAPPGTVVSTITWDNGTAPFNLVDLDGNANFTVNVLGQSIVVSLTGPGDPGVSNVNIRITDSAGLIATSGEVPITVTDPAVGVLITTKVLTNNDATNAPANFHAKMVGLEFVQGDIPAGTWPEIRLDDGSTVVPTTLCTPRASYHLDGSLKFVPALCRIPVALNAGASMNLKVYSAGTLPDPSGLSPSDVAAVSNLQIKKTGLDNLSGDWISYLNHGISNTNQSFAGALPDIQIIGDGPAGIVCRIRASYEQSSAPHGQLEEIWFLQILADENGDYAGLRLMPFTTQPWMDNDTPSKNWRSFTANLISDPTSGFSFDVFQDRYGATNSITVSYTSTQWATKLTGKQPVNGMYCLYHTDGDPIGGLTNDTYYWIVTDNSAGKINGSKVSFFVDEIHTQSAPGSAYIHLTGAGSGTHTLTFYPYLTHFGFPANARNDAQYHYAQAGGTKASDYNTQWKFEIGHMLGSNLVPPYRVRPTANVVTDVYDYFWEGFEPFYRGIGSTGPRPDIGPITGYQCFHMQNQTKNHDRLIRVCGLYGGMGRIAIRDKTNKRPLNVSKGSYAGMTAKPTFRWPDSGTGWTPPPATTVAHMGNTLPDYSHVPSFSAYPYIVTGEPQYWEISLYQAMGTVYECSNVSSFGPINPVAQADDTRNAMGTLYTRQKSINGTIYDNCLIQTGQMRGDAWSIRDVVNAWNFIGPDDPDGAIYSTYLRDIVTSTFGAAVAFIAMNTDYFKSHGLWPTGSWESAWQRKYLMIESSFAAVCTGEANGVSFIEHLMKYENWRYETFGVQGLVDYFEKVRINTNPNTPSVAIITSDDQWGAEGPTLNITAGNVKIFATTSGNFGWLPSVGDNWMCEDAIPALGVTDPFTNLWCVQSDKNGDPFSTANKGRGSFELSLTPGGTPIVPSATANVDNIWMAWDKSGWVTNSYHDKEYMSNQQGGLQAAKWAGATNIDPDMLADVNTVAFWGANAIDWNGAEIMWDLIAP